MGSLPGVPKTEEHKQNIRLALTGHFVSDETRGRISLSNKGKLSWNKGLHHSEETRKKISERQMGVPSSVEARQKISNSLIGKPSRQKGNVWTPEQRQYQSFRLKGINKGKNNGNWNGGTSGRKYPFGFNNILKQKIKFRDNHRCQVCLHFFPDILLWIHHIDYNIENLDEFNLVSVCCHCHPLTNKNRENWIIYFESVIKEIYEKLVSFKISN